MQSTRPTAHADPAPPVATEPEPAAEATPDPERPAPVITLRSAVPPVADQPA